MIKGIITGLIMVGIFLSLYYTNQPANSPYQYLLDLVYAGGIAWTLLHYARSQGYIASFKAIFSQGFRCFMVVTTIMVIFTWIFYANHPEISKEAGTHYREYLKDHEKDKTVVEKEQLAVAYEKQFTNLNVYSAVFGFLLRGIIFTAGGAALLLTRRRNK